jgi:hypothetical protein
MTSGSPVPLACRTITKRWSDTALPHHPSHPRRGSTGSSYRSPRKLHAVPAGEGSDRLTISAFLGYRGHTETMTVWS